MLDETRDIGVAGLIRISSAWPSWTTAPSFISTMRPPSAIASSRSCDTNTMVFCSRFCSSTSSCCMSRRISGSSALNASSISSTAASAASARASPARCFMPPESWLG